MVDLPEAGARLAAYRAEPTPPVAEIVERRDRRRRRRARRALGGGALVGAISLVLAFAMAGPPSGSRRLDTGTAPDGAATSIPVPSVPSAGVAQLAGGTWSGLPAAPIEPRSDASVTWTGREMLVWGGASGTQRDQLRDDGAAFDPSTGQWRRLAPAPLSPRTAQAVVWTGSLMIVWGGYDRVSLTEFHVTSDGAAYDPATDTWSPLPPAPLAGRANALAVWSGDRMMLLGGRPAVTADPMPGLGDGAAYDPARGVWQHIDPAPAGHGLSWQTAASSGGELFAWSTWYTTTPTGPGSSTSTGGADLFAFTLSTGRWRQIQPGAGAVEDPAQVLGAGRLLLVRGFPFSCGYCSHPYRPLATALYDPGRNSWSPVPPDPLGGNGMLSVWTGAALASFDPSFTGGGPSGTVVPGDASAYDPVADQWTRLPRAPFGCDTRQAPLWTGTQVLIYCPRGDATHDGLALTVEP